jgi:hypothetical protein
MSKQATDTDTDPSNGSQSQNSNQNPKQDQDHDQDNNQTSTLASSAMEMVNEQRREGKITGASVGKFLSKLGKAKVKDVNVDPQLGELGVVLIWART